MDERVCVPLLCVVKVGKPGYKSSPARSFLVDAYEKILQKRFGVTTRITDHTTYRELTAGTTDEPAWHFQEIHAEQIVRIINTFEEMPAGMRTVAGLKYLVRRLDGTKHPLYPEAPAVAWTGSGYIEFDERQRRERGGIRVQGDGDRRDGQFGLLFRGNRACGSDKYWSI